MSRLFRYQSLTIVFLCIILGSSTLATPNETAAPPLRFQRLTVADGLSSPRVIETLQDDQGFIWMATENGLNRYDGHRFRHFVEQPKKKNALADDYIHSFERGDENIFWISTKHGGLHRFDPELERFERFGYDAASGMDPQYAGLLRLRETRDHGWWGFNNRGLIRWDEPTRQIIQIEMLPDELRSQSVQAVLEITPGTLWIGSSNGLFELDLKDERVTRPAAVRSHPNLQSVTIIGLLKGLGSDIWLISNLGLIRVSGENQARQYTVSGTIRALFLDSSDRLWVATAGEGLALFDRQTETFVHYRNDPLDPQSLASDLVFSIFEDRDGILWIGTNSGASLLEPSRQAFAVYQRDLEQPRSMPYQNIVSMERDGEGHLWLGSFGEGLIRLDSDRKNPHRLRNDPELPQSISHDFVWDLHLDRQGDLWVGTEAGLDHVSSDQLSRDNPVFTHFVHEKQDPESLLEGRVLTLLEDRQGRLWIGGSAGLNLFQPESATFKHFENDPERPESLAPSPVMALHEDAEGIIWIGLDGEGLDRLDPVTETFTHYKRDTHDPLTLGGEIVTAIQPGPNGTLWIASYGGGLEHFHPTTGEFIDVLPAELPVNPSVSNLLSDRSGHLWLTIGQDAFQFQPATQKLTAFNPSDGLITRYSPKSALKLPNGELLWGGHEGFMSIVPERIVSSDEPPTVAITDFRVLDRQIEIDEWHSGSVELTHSDSLFWIDFAALHFAEPSKHRYRYRLEGLNNDWIETDASSPGAQFSSLKPGSYTFRVQACRRDGVWGEDSTPLQIFVRPPVWQTGWAYGLYALILSALIWAYVGSQRRKLAAERVIAERERAVSQRLRDVDRLKDEFLANTSHELRTPLYGITGLAESLADGATGELPESTQECLAMIIASGRRLSRLVGSILDFSKLRHHSLELSLQPVDLRALVEVVLTLLRPLVDEQQLVLVNGIPSDLPPADADENRLQQILFNLVGNSIKFTESGQIEVTAVVDQAGPTGELTISVNDTGIGIDEAQLQRIFEPFEQIDGSDETTFGGTGLGLALSRQLVEAHGGSLWATSTPEVGSSFSFSLPVSTHRIGEALPSPPMPALEPPSKALESSSDASPKLPTRDPTGRRILVVDDEKINRQILVAHLTQEGHTTGTASTGAGALSQLEQQPFDLVLLDVMMPKMTGYEVCRQIRRQHSIEELPVLFLTALSQTEDRLTGLKLGANDFLIKPVSKDELLARVHTQLTLLDAHRELVGQVAETAEELRVLSGFLPICSSCKKIRNDDGSWQQMESYIHQHSEASFSHGICPTCTDNLFPEFQAKDEQQ